jgi:hypothetical protein
MTILSIYDMTVKKQLLNRNILLALSDAPLNKNEYS